MAGFPVATNPNQQTEGVAAMKMAGVTSLRRAGLVLGGGVGHCVLDREGFTTDQHDNRHRDPRARSCYGLVHQTVGRPRQNMAKGSA